MKYNQPISNTHLVHHHLEDVPLPHHARARLGHRLGLLPLGCRVDGDNGKRRESRGGRRQHTKGMGGWMDRYELDQTQTPFDNCCILLRTDRHAHACMHE